MLCQTAWPSLLAPPSLSWRRASQSRIARSAPFNSDFLRRPKRKLPRKRRTTGGRQWRFAARCAGERHWQAYSQGAAGLQMRRLPQ